MTTQQKYLLPGLNELACKILQRNVRAGFYEPEHVRPMDGQLMNVVAEVAEAQEEWRCGRGVQETYFKVSIHGDDPDFERELFRSRDGKLYVRNEDYDLQQGLPDPAIPPYLELTPELWRQMPNIKRYAKPEGIPSELADIIIRVLDICGFHGINIAAAIADKMDYNETRPYRHGGKLS